MKFSTEAISTMAEIMVSEIQPIELKGEGMPLGNRSGSSHGWAGGIISVSKGRNILAEGTRWLERYLLFRVSGANSKISLDDLFWASACQRNPICMKKWCSSVTARSGFGN